MAESGDATQEQVRAVYADNTPDQLSNLKQALISETTSQLEGPRLAWTVQIVNDTPQNFVDAIHFVHPAYDEDTSVTVEYEPTEGGYAVYRPTATDIFTDGQKLTLYEALKLAVEMANQERRRHLSTRRERLETAAQHAAIVATNARKHTAKALRASATTLRRVADVIEP